MPYRAAPTALCGNLPPWACALQLLELIATTRHNEQAWHKREKRRRRGTLNLPSSRRVILACQASPWSTINLKTAEPLHEFYELWLPWRHLDHFGQQNWALVFQINLLLCHSAASGLLWSRERWNNKRRVQTAEKSRSSLVMKAWIVS